MSGRLRPLPGIERLSADDMMMLSGDVGPVPMQVGAILLLGPATGLDLAAVTEVLAARIPAVPRLRQRLVRPPAGCGRPVWVDDGSFDIAAHVRSVTCRPPGDEAALCDTAMELATRRLPWTRPLWSAALVTGLTGTRTAIVVVFHHVLADGIGGLAALASLMDGAGAPAPPPFPRPAPSRRDLAADAARARVTALASGLAAARRLRPALAEINPGRVSWPRRTSLNQPTGPGRRLIAARAGLAPVRAAARERAATVNDAMLTAVARALRGYLADRGEQIDDLVATVLVSGRTATGPGALGNAVGVMPVRLPAAGGRDEQLARVAALTRARKTASRGASAGLLRTGFRALAALGLLRWFTEHQRAVNVFVTNLRGPGDVQRFAGVPVTGVVPITIVTGNVTLSFGVISYAGSLTVAIVADRDSHQHLDRLAALLQSELDGLAAAGAAAAAGATGSQGAG